jgi:hypothetical protein
VAPAVDAARGAAFRIHFTGSKKNMMAVLKSLIYSAATIGATVVKGAGGSQFQNDKDVFLSVKNKSEGIELNLGEARWCKHRVLEVIDTRFYRYS